LDFVPIENMERFRKDFDTLLVFLKQNNVRVFVCSYPTLISPETINIPEYQIYFLFARIYAVELTYKGLMDAACKFNQIIDAASREHGVDFIDTNAKVPKNTEYFADNVHYTDTGALRVAETIAAYILNNQIR
jgi:hypothetical protein